MYEFTFTNSLGENIYIAYGTPFVLESVQGLSGATSLIQSEKAPFQDGSTYIDTLLNSRIMTFVVQIRSDLENNRRKAIRVLNSKLGKGTLRFTKNGVWRELECVIDTNPNFIEDYNNRKIGRFSFTIEAPQPYWTDAEQQWTLASFLGGFSFPFSFPVNFGTIGSTVIINNQGDTVAPLFITLSGPLTNPTLTNETTGEYITLAQDLPDGYTLEINTASGSKSIIVIDEDGNRSNGFAYISPDSTLFGLAIGQNTLSYIADVQPSDVAVTVFYKNRYIGV